MGEPDRWGMDPGVRLMRAVFAEMEAVQAELLRQTGLSPFDVRLRRWRDRALDRFQREWAGSRGEAGDLYRRCLVAEFAADGIRLGAAATASEAHR